MPDQRAIHAVGRIERAIARIEAASDRLAHRPDTSATAAAAQEELQTLRRAHDALRDKVKGAISQIDRMLDKGEQV